MKKVLVSGCFDMLHSGHVRFLEKASEYGKLYVSVANDKNILYLKKKHPVCSQDERLYMVKSLSFVEDAFVPTFLGVFDFLDLMNEVQPRVFVVNRDGHSKDKEDILRTYGVEYVVLNREPKTGLPKRSSTDLRNRTLIPYRIDLAGGWLDQPFISRQYPGAVVTISIEPDHELSQCSGMATSTRDKAQEIWGISLPEGNEEKLAKILFAYDNPPGTSKISGAQDAIGIVYKGLTKQYYSGSFWPQFTERIYNEDILKWLEQRIIMIPIKPREKDYNPFSCCSITYDKIKNLADSSVAFWKHVLQMDALKTGKYMKKCFEAQIDMFPEMADEDLLRAIDYYNDQFLGYKVSGAGGGGYLIGFTENEIKEGLKIRIRR